MSELATDRTYAQVYAASIDDPETFWGDAAKDIDWITPPTRVLDASRPPFYRWFPGATLNTCFNALDRHVEAGRGGQVALCYDSPVTGTKRAYTYAEVLAEVRRLAGALAGAGVGKGDRVVVYMPMVPEAAFAMLACARIGAIHSVVFGGFAPAELAARIDDAQPKLILSASCGIEPSRVVPYKPFLDEGIARSEHKPDLVVILQREQGLAPIGERDIDWQEFVGSAAGDAGADCVEVEATDPLYILYTSGTTGKPKGIYRDNGGHAVALRWSMRNIYNVEPGETMFTASDVGWVVGHSYIVYAPLLTGAPPGVL
ncbi:MAG TPA: AMP-binding protein [Candidatus Lustribacter sp.]|nr:AMP-binding protein [Candidatus Lustribacter sp.]